MKNFLYFILIFLTLSLPTNTHANKIKEPINYIKDPANYIDNKNTPGNSVVKITAKSESLRKEIIATGFSVGYEKEYNVSYIITNDHFCSEINNEDYDIPFYEKITSPYSLSYVYNPKPAIVFASDSKRDLCLILAEGEVKPLDIESYKYKTFYGQPALTIGAPNGIWPIFTQTFVSGLASKEGTTLYDDNEPILLISGTFFPGQSGSPLLNEDNKVIGIIFGTTIIDQVEKPGGLAIRHQELLDFLDDISSLFL